MKHFSCRLVLLAALLTQPALAQTTDQLTDAIGTVPFSAGTSSSFLYVSAKTVGFMAQAQTMQDIVEQNLINALAYAENDTISGVDFSRVTAVLSYGQSADRITILFGEQGFAQAAPATLQQRRYEEREIAGWTVFGLGEDGLVKPTFNSPDPFATAMGRPQRLAIADTMLVSAASWTKMEQVLADLSETPDTPSLWSATLAGSLKAMPGEEPSSIMGFTTDGNPAITPLSSISMLTFAFSQAGVTMVSASPFDSAETAQQSARTMQERTGNIHPPGATVSIETVARGGWILQERTGNIHPPGATVSIEVEEAPPHFIGMVKITEPAGASQ